MTIIAFYYTSAGSGMNIKTKSDLVKQNNRNIKRLRLNYLRPTVITETVSERKTWVYRGERERIK